MITIIFNNYVSIKKKKTTHSSNKSSEGKAKTRIIKSYGEDEVWILAHLPPSTSYASCGSSLVVIKWSLEVGWPFCCYLFLVETYHSPLQMPQ